MFASVLALMVVITVSLFFLDLTVLIWVVNLKFTVGTGNTVVFVKFSEVIVWAGG